MDSLTVVKVRTDDGGEWGFCFYAQGVPIPLVGEVIRLTTGDAPEPEEFKVLRRTFGYVSLTRRMETLVELDVERVP